MFLFSYSFFVTFFLFVSVVFRLVLFCDFLIFFLTKTHILENNTDWQPPTRREIRKRSNKHRPSSEGDSGLAQPHTFTKLVFLIEFDQYYIFLNWLSGALVGVVGSDFHRLTNPPSSETPARPSPDPARDDLEARGSA